MGWSQGKNTRKLLHGVAHDSDRRAHSRLLIGSRITPANTSTCWLWRYLLAKADLAGVSHPAERNCAKDQARIPKPVL